MDNYYSQIKEQIINNEITKQVKNYSINKSDLTAYYNIGKILNDAGKHYGESVIKQYSIKLTNELGKGFTTSRLKYFRRFFDIFSKGPTLSDKLSFSHYCEIIWLNDIEEIKYYIDITIKKINHNKTIGIIICKKENKFIMEYSSDNRILSREYQLI